jgi:hypothetical protein
MPTSTQFVQAGACNVIYDGIDLGLTKGGTKVEVSMDTKVVTVDQFGDAVIDEFIKGRSVKVMVPMAESDVEKLVRVIPGATLTGTTEKKLSIPSGAGLSMRTLAKVLKLHPTGLDAGDEQFDFTVPLAAAKGAFSFSFQPDEERIYEVEFTGFVNLDTGLLFYFGPAVAV